MSGVYLSGDALEEVRAALLACAEWDAWPDGRMARAALALLEPGAEPVEDREMRESRIRFALADEPREGLIRRLAAALVEDDTPMMFAPTMTRKVTVNVHVGNTDWLAAIRKAHVAYTDDFGAQRCEACIGDITGWDDDEIIGAEWPCDVVIVLDRLAAAERVVAVAREEVDNCRDYVQRPSSAIENLRDALATYDGSDDA